jgi:hypothetical protein
MGECGCGGDNPEFRIEGADGFHYGVGIYTGCRYCHTPVGLDIYRYTDDDAADFLDPLEPVKVPGYMDDDRGSGRIGMPILDIPHLVAALSRAAEDGERGPFALDEEDVRWAVEEAMTRTRDEWSPNTPKASP